MEKLVYRSKEDFAYFSQLSSLDLKEFIFNYRNLSLSQLKEILYILHQREGYKIEKLSILSEIISHFNLVRSGELYPSVDEISSYFIEKIKDTKHETNNYLSSISELKMIHAGKLISKSGKYLFFSEMMLITIPLITLLMIFSNRWPNTSEDIKVAYFLFIIFGIVYVGLKLVAYSSIHNAGKIFEDNT